MNLLNAFDAWDNYDILLMDDEEIDHKILKERNESIQNLEQDITDISDIWSSLASMVNIQGEEIDMVDHQVEVSVTNTNDGLIQLKKSKNLLKDRLSMVRDVALVIGGGILGTPGFLLGPIIGVGTVIAGASAGGITAFGIHKVSTNQK